MDGHNAPFCRNERGMKIGEDGKPFHVQHGLPTPAPSPAEECANPWSIQDLPRIASLHPCHYQHEDYLVADICESLKQSGGCIIRNMISRGTLDALELEVRPFLNNTAVAHENRDEFVPSSTRMVTGLLSKSTTYALHVAGNPIWQHVGAHFLTSTLRNYWHGDTPRSSISPPQLSTTVTFSVQPGTRAQSLHRDDDIYHTHHPAAPRHQMGRDTMVCFFVAGTRTRQENGATRIIPGSHLWDYSIPPPAADDTTIRCAELEPGDAFMMLGGCYHGAGANVTKDEERLVYAAFSTRGYLRQEENQYLSNNMEKIKELPVWLQRYAGFGTARPFMGWVDMKDPVNLMNQDVDEEEEFW